MEIEMHALVSGHVQGVGFRYTTVVHAKKLQLVGTVRNLPNGQVEIFAQGAKEDLTKLIQLLNISSGLARVSDVQLEFYPIQDPYVDFTIS